MAEIPTHFRLQPTAVIATYDWVDIAEGTGIVRFYGYNEKDSSGTNHKLNNNAVYSYDIVGTAFAVPEAAFAKLQDLDFDLSAFNLPKNLKGTATFQIPASITAGIGAGNNCYLYVKVRVRKSDDTEIALVQTNTITANNTATTYQILIASVAVPLTHFKKGEILRVTLEMWGQTVGASGAGQGQIAHDPKDREGGNFTAANIGSRIFEAQIPFRI